MRQTERMQLIHHFPIRSAARLMRRRKTVLVAGPRLADLAKTCRDLGLDVEEVGDLYDALAAISDDPAGYGALLMDADEADGTGTVQVSVRLLRSIAPDVEAILVPRDRPSVPFPEITIPGGVRVSGYEAAANVTSLTGMTSA